MENISKQDIKALKKAYKYIMRETTPTFRQQSAYYKLFYDKSIEYNVPLQELYTFISKQ